MRLRLGIIITLIAAFSTSALHAGALDIKDYIKQRQKIVTKLPIETIKSDVGSYIGKVIEIRGNLAGFSKNDNGVFLVVSGENGSFVISTNIIPNEGLGTEIACLVKIGEGCTYSLSDLKLISYTYDTELKRIEKSVYAKEKTKSSEKTIDNLNMKSSVNAAQPQSDVKKAQTSNQTITVEEVIKIYSSAIKGFNKKLSDNQANTIARAILGFSQHYKIDPRLVVALIVAESDFRIDCRSRAGAMGLGQLMPSTAASLKLSNPYDPIQNIYGSIRHLKGYLDKMSGGKEWNELNWRELVLALACYNAGPGAVKKYGGVPPYRETQNYVRRVSSLYKKLCGVE